MKIILVSVSLSMTLFGLTLSESIDLALKNSPKIAISQSNVKYNEYMKDEASSAYHPSLHAGFSWQKLENPTAFSFSPSHNYNLSLKYNIFNGFSDYLAVSSKESEIESARLESKAVMADLKLEVIVAYTNYLKVQKSIKVQEDQLSSLTKQYNDTEVKYEQGVVAKNDLLLIEVEKLKAQQALIKAKSDFVLAKSNLENVMATKVLENDNVDDFDASVEEVDSMAVLEKQMLENRSEIKAMMFLSQSLQSQKDAITGNYLPKVNLEASHQINDKERTSGTAIFQPKDQTTYGVNVSWALYSGLRNVAVKKALLEKDNQQNYQLHQLKLDLQNQLVSAYENLKVAKSAKSVALKAKESAEENYRITSDRYSYGDVDTLTLLVSQTNLTQAENANNDAYYNLYVAYKTLLRIVSE